MRMLAFVAGVALTVVGLGVTGAAQAQPIKGHLMDMMCASMHATEPGYTEKHDKKCLLMDGCIKSGYTLVTTDKKVLKLDAKGNQLALDLIKKTDRQADWAVAVNGSVSGDTIAVASIQLQ
jgi:hypothetical protein